MKGQSKVKRRGAYLLTGVIAATGLSLGVASPASASACRVPPCGQVVNRLDRAIEFRFNNGDGIGWRRGWVTAGSTAGGFYHDRIDIDEIRIPPNTCWDVSGWPLGQRGGSSGRWFKIRSFETAVVHNVYPC